MAKAGPVADEAGARDILAIALNGDVVASVVLDRAPATVATASGQVGVSRRTPHRYVHGGRSGLRVITRERAKRFISMPLERQKPTHNGRLLLINIVVRPLCVNLSPYSVSVG
jgi:hypothetical protein